MTRQPMSNEEDVAGNGDRSSERKTLIRTNRHQLFKVQLVSVQVLWKRQS